MPKKLIEIAAEILHAQVSLTPMSVAEIDLSLRQIFGVLCELQKAETAGIDIECAQLAAKEVAAAKLTPQDSIQNDKVICLECGKEMLQLTTKHLVSHEMNQKEYKKKYGFAMGTPLAANSLIKARSKAAIKRGLPDKLRQYLEARRRDKVQPSVQAEIATVTTGIQKPVLTPQNSIQDDKVICLECGAEMRQLTSKHLVSHGMNQKEYRQKYGFSMQTPLAAKSVSKAQSKAAKKRGLPEKLTQLNEARRKEKTESAAQSAGANPAGKPRRSILRKKNAV
jgi:predicted transcriptional regulator